jgi:hypothetical protein
MSNDKISQFPTTSWERWKNRLGKRAVACVVTDRWLQFGEASTPIRVGDVVCLDVMTRPDGETTRKICRLWVSKQDLLAAISEIDKPEL